MSVTIDGTTGLVGQVGNPTTSAGAFTTISGTDLTTTGNTILGNASTDTLNVGNGDLIKDASGNVGIGVTPSAWYSLSKVVQVGVGGAIEGRSNYYPYLALTSNVYLDSGGDYKTLSTDLSTRYLATAGVHTWYSAPSIAAGSSAAFVARMTLDASGNLGVGVTPSAWNTGYKVLQFFDVTSGSILNSGYASQTTVNAWLNSSSQWIYGGGSYAPSRYQQFNGAHTWYTAPSGTAGNPITFTQAMTLDASSNLTVGGSLQVGNTAVIKGAKIQASANASSGAYVNLITTSNLSAGSAGTIMVVGAENGNTNTAYYIIQFAKSGASNVGYSGLNGVALASVGGTIAGNGNGALSFVQTGTSLTVRSTGGLPAAVTASITYYPDF